jgi:hypothetical protein
MPTADAIQCVEATTPKVPLISGRVVNMMGSASGIWAEISPYAARELRRHRGADAIVMGQPLFLTPARIQERWAVVAFRPRFLSIKGSGKAMRAKSSTPSSPRQTYRQEGVDARADARA